MTALIKIGPAAATAIMRASPWNTPEMTNSTVLLATFFGRKRIGTFDRLGSAKYNQNNAAQSFYPYGEDRGTMQPNDSLKFATYTRDAATGLDYADQRYYASNFGRFMTPDRYKAKARSASDPANPPSWNRYSYVLGDPINGYDPSGRFWCNPDMICTGDPGGGPYCDDEGEGGPQDCGGGGGSGGDDSPYVGLTDQEENSTIHPGSTSFSQAQSALMRAKNELFVQFLGPQSANCEKDLAAVGVTDAQVWSAAQAANIVYGLTAFSAYALDAYGNSSAYSAAEATWGNISMVQYMTLVAPNAAAVAQLNGSNIYINPSWVNGMSSLQQEAMVLHELLHNITGQTDDVIQGQLGLSTTAASQNIGDKLMKDCLQ